MSLYNLSVTQQGTCCSSGCGMMEWRFLYDRENKFAIDYTNEIQYRLDLPQLDANIVPEATVEVLEDLLQKHEAGKKTHMALFAQAVEGEALSTLEPLVKKAYDLKDGKRNNPELTELAIEMKKHMTVLGYLAATQVGCTE